jgi:hypothetical protein
MSIASIAPCLSAQGARDRLIVPGVRVGPITRQSTENDLKRYFGASQILHQEVPVLDAGTALGLVVYRSARYQPSNRVLTIFSDEAGHPGTVVIYDRCGGRKAALGLEPRCGNWRSVTGSHSPSTDPDGISKVAWCPVQGGTLEKEFGHALGLALFPAVDVSGNRKAKLRQREYDSVQGAREILSTDAVLRKIDLRVTEVRNIFH